MRKLLKVLPVLAVLTIFTCLLTACAGNRITVGEIPPPPTRPTPPPVAQPPTGQSATGAAGGTVAGAGTTTGPTPVTPAEVHVLSFPHITNTTHPRGLAIESIAELAAERSGGRLEINVFPDSQLGNDTQVLAQLMQGNIGITSSLNTILTSTVPELALFDMPYLFFTMEQAFAALNGSLGDFLTDIMAEHGLINFGYFTSGFKHFTNNVRPIHYVTDLAGVQMRVSQSQFLISQFLAINAGAASIPFADLYSALGIGLVDGQENPLATIVSARFYEVQDYITISNHGFTVYPIFMHESVYNSLPEDLRVLIRQIIAEVMPIQWALIEESVGEQLQFLYTTDVNINYMSGAAMQGFRAATQVVYDEFAQMPRGAELLSIASRYVN